MFPLVGYILLFVAVGAGFILINLLVGKLIRPVRPHSEKDTIYECGEPTIGSAWVQFDLRFYVVALLFVIFDVEVAFFFPWAVVFGKSNTLANENQPIEQRVEAYLALTPHRPENANLPASSPARQAQEKRDRIVALQAGGVEQNREVLERELSDVQGAARTLGWIALFDILVFFGILLVGFAYLWKRGDLQWVRAVASETVRPLHRVQQTPQTAGTGS